MTLETFGGGGICWTAILYSITSLDEENQYLATVSNDTVLFDKIKFQT